MAAPARRAECRKTDACDVEVSRGLTAFVAIVCRVPGYEFPIASPARNRQSRKPPCHAAICASDNSAGGTRQNSNRNSAQASLRLTARTRPEQIRGPFRRADLPPLRDLPPRSDRARRPTRGRTRSREIRRRRLKPWAMDRNNSASDNCSTSSPTRSARILAISGKRKFPGLRLSVMPPLL
jgi:hypothetical protein